MRRVLRRRPGPPGDAATGGVVRLDRRTKDLAKRLQPGDVAVIDHEDVDRVAADSLVAARPAAVVNAAASTSGRYPNIGPQVLVEAGVVLVDGVGPEVMTLLTEGQRVRVDGDDLVLLDEAGERVVASGTRQTSATVAAAMEAAREGLSTQLEAFAANTMEYMLREKDLLLDGIGVPEVRTSFAGRQALLVVRGYHYREDLATLRSYIREYRPVLIGVDGGADAVLEAGHRLDMVVGDMDSVSDAALTSGAEVVVHAYRDGRAPGLDRVQALGVDPVVFPATGTSEDVAMMLADDGGAELIVAVGTHATLVEFLDKGRAGMASTFLTRLRVGGKLVDAKGVSRLYRQRISTAQVAALLVAGLLALLVALLATSAGQTLVALLGAQLDGLVAAVRGWAESP
jgi:uncharacterized membrane-anchored protein